MLYMQAAARPERQPFDPRVLRQILRRLVGIGGNRGRRTAHGQAAHGAGRGEIALHQRLGHPQHAADVVEAEAGIVGRKQVVGFHFDRQQIADGVDADVGEIQRVQRQADRAELRDERRGRFAGARHHRRVVAGDAVALEQGAVVGRLGLGGSRPRCSQAQGKHRCRHERREMPLAHVVNTRRLAAHAPESGQSYASMPWIPGC